MKKMIYFCRMGLLKNWKNRNAVRKFSSEQLELLKTQPRFIPGTIDYSGKAFHYHDAQCFYDSYQEILNDEMYRFETNYKNPVILDCGANMGVSVLFFAKAYPQATIIAFEPEEEIYNILEKNIETYGLKNVSLHKNAVWTCETTLEFYSDHGMGGSVENVFRKQEPALVKTVRLADYLQQPVALLKMDIEGAEYEVLKDCEQYFHNIENMFVEYHSFDKKEQHLDDLLTMLKKAGFRYHLRQSFSRKKPFIDRKKVCENIDMAINVFAYRS